MTGKTQLNLLCVHTNWSLFILDGLAYKLWLNLLDTRFLNLNLFIKINNFSNIHDYSLNFTVKYFVGLINGMGLLSLISEKLKKGHEWSLKKFI
jgi:hypothetical protein